MKIEIINKPMLCWDNYEKNAKIMHVLARVTDCKTEYLYKTIDQITGEVEVFKHAKNYNISKDNIELYLLQKSFEHMHTPKGELYKEMFKELTEQE